MNIYDKLHIKQCQVKKTQIQYVHKNVVQTSTHFEWLVHSITASRCQSVAHKHRKSAQRKLVTDSLVSIERRKHTTARLSCRRSDRRWRVGPTGQLEAISPWHGAAVDVNEVGKDAIYMLAIDEPMTHRRTGGFYQHWCNANRDLEILRFFDTASAHHLPFS